MADSGKFRVVRCPKCKKFLQELADNPVYQCGGCEAVLQAKGSKARNALSTGTEAVGQQFQAILEDIWRPLTNDSASLIAICGTGGIGKTTLAKHTHNQMLKHPNTFGNVLWVTVPRNYNVWLLQHDIARAISFDISFEDDEMKRAVILAKELKTRTESSGRVLIILDDLQNVIELQDIGIPVQTIGCKVIVTSPSLDMCYGLGCQNIYTVPLMSDVDAWDLFLNNLELSKLEPPIEHIARKIAMECFGLPLAIKTVARSLRNAIDFHEWVDVYWALSNSKDSFQRLKICYNRLRDSNLQQCFLYCALYFKDVDETKRDELVNHLIKEDLIDGVTHAKMFNKGHAILNMLISSGLLEAVESSLEANQIQCVKMHDVIRDMALQILAGDDNVMRSISTQHSSGMYLRVILEWGFVLTNFILETLSTVFDQISSPKRPQFALISMAMSFLAFLICTLELLYRARKERAVWRQCWFYRSDKPLGSFADNFGFICAASQCLTSTIQYVFFRSHSDNPIKVSFFPVMLALSFLYMQFTKKRQLQA